MPTDLNLALATWRLTDARATPMAGGEVKRLWHVDTGERRLVLRVYPPTVEPRSVALECAWLEALGAQLPEVPRPIPTPAGNAFAMVGRVCAVLAPYVAGEPLDPTDRAQQRLLAAGLARLHAAAAMLDDPDQASAFPSLSRLDWEANQWWDVAEIAQRLSDTPLWSLVAPRLERVPDLLRSLDGLPRQAIHNDISLGNILTDGGQIVGLIDWDWATIDWRCLDIVHALRTVARLGRPEYIWDRVVDFVHSYRSAGGQLGADEVAALPALASLNFLWVALYDLGRATRGRASSDAVAYRASTLLRLDDQLSRWAVVST